jgi:hypothetical protein
MPYDYMRFDENLAAIHAYLCADGYVIRNPPTQKNKYYKMGLRNTNLILLKDFQMRFEKVFGISPHIRKDGRCEVGSRETYEKLTKEFGSFYSWEWRMPKLSDKLAGVWLRAYFDCEGWVFCKSHQNRHIGADCVNKIGLDQVEEALNKLGIVTIRKFNKKRNIHRLVIYGKENFIKFNDKIGLLHPDKANKLKEVIEDYVEYKWDIPKNETECRKFVRELFLKKARIRKPYYVRVFSREEINITKLKRLLKKIYGIRSRTYKCINGIGTIYYELDVNRKEEVEKLIKNYLIKNIFKRAGF